MKLQTEARDYAEDEIRRMATKLARLALSGTSSEGNTGPRRP